MAAGQGGTPDSTRRFSDSDLCQKIMGMIDAEADQKERTRLMVLLQFANLLIDNVNIIRSMVNEIEEHKVTCETQLATTITEFKQDAKKIGTFKTGTYYLSGVLVVVMGLCGVVYTDRVQELQEVKAKYEILSNSMGDMNTELIKIKVIVDSGLMASQGKKFK